jgi:two-component system, NarL family, sensor kinase
MQLAINEDVTLQIVDDGMGIPAGRSAGVGLSSMHERASELGGSCTVESVPEGGTRVLVHLPLSKE